VTSVQFPDHPILIDYGLCVCVSVSSSFLSSSLLCSFVLSFALSLSLFSLLFLSFHPGCDNSYLTGTLIMFFVAYLNWYDLRLKVYLVFKMKYIYSTGF
jgi:hypothetical protein